MMTPPSFSFNSMPKGITFIDCLPHGADSYWLSTLLHTAKHPIVFIARDDKRMMRLHDQMQVFAPSFPIITLPAWDCLPYDRASPAHHIASSRVQNLCKIVTLPKGQPALILTTINACLQKIPPLEFLNRHTLYLKIGQSIARDTLVTHLIQSGYIRAASTAEPGEFSVRGSLIDIIPGGATCGYRLDFFGEQLDSIRCFDPLTQISQGTTQELFLIPTSELMLQDETITRFRNQYRALFNVMNRDDPLYEHISSGRHYAGAEHWLPLFYEKMDTLFDYLPQATLCFDHLTQEAAFERMATIADYYDARREATEHSDIPYHPIEPHLLYLMSQEWQTRLHHYPQLVLSPFASDETGHTVYHASYRLVPSLITEARTKQVNVFEQLKTYLAEQKEQHRKTHSGAGMKCIIACFSGGSRERLRTILNDHDFHTIFLDSWEDRRQVSGKTLGLLILELDQGFIGDGYIVLSEQDLLGPRLSQRKTRKQSERFFLEASHLNEGELVVHQEHGIGRFEALETLIVSGEKHDCLRIIYADGDKFYLPVENIETLSRYGSEQEGVKLDKLGGVAWQERKASMKKRVREIAKELLVIAAKRQLKKAPALTAVSGMYEEFCARFPYAETDDQLRAIEDVTTDLQSGKPMDRLICGDVGFGKTEIALRAAFIAASNHDQKQVAVIAPTTLLARQHLKTFEERFQGFPFNVQGLSRLTPSASAAQTKKGITDGTVDIAVGTHALLAKSIQFKNLGLVIVDEEQLFGVTQKERLKQLQSEVHVLSLSATPIPRTLQMSLSGIKELSLIATPPIDRLAIRSYMMPFDDVVVRNAILREYYRGGKTFIVLPRIKDLDTMEERLKRIVPEVTMVKAHGQMLPAQLDSTMNDFYDGKYDILISTNIIGSGLDVPTANTIIIHKADQFGLAQLYQMRGRVGRGKIRAYAYFTTDPRRIPSAMALKRLEIMQNLDALGAGFSLASHDMELRGFGNLVGEEQSGHIREVGVELYQSLLEEAIQAAKQESRHLATTSETESFSPRIQLGISVFIPDDYIADVELRLGLYRRIAAQKTAPEIEAIAVEMIDRFGALPEPVSNLLEIMKLKLLCIQAGIEKVDVGPKGGVISFYNNCFAKPEVLIEYIHKHPTTTKLRGDQKLVLLQSWETPKQRIDGIQQSLETILSMAA